jgi:hypothetical protein
LIRSLCSFELKDRELGRPGQLGQSGVGDLGVGETEHLELGERLQLGKAGVGDAGFFEGKHFEVAQSGQLGQARVGDWGVVEVQYLELGDRTSGLSGTRDKDALTQSREGAKQKRRERRGPWSRCRAR